MELAITLVIIGAGVALTVVLAKRKKSGNGPDYTKTMVTQDDLN